MSRYEAMQYAGVGLVTAGIAFIFWPAALIVAGLALAVLAQAGAR
jgi:hypothetical protein